MATATAARNTTRGGGVGSCACFNPSCERGEECARGEEEVVLEVKPGRERDAH